MMGGELRGLRALVSGASKGIGSAIARRLRDEGATVLGTARTIPTDLPKDVQFAAADFPSVDGCNALVEAVSTRLREIDIAVHIVGGSSAPAGGFAAPLPAKSAIVSMATKQAYIDYLAGNVQLECACMAAFSGSFARRKVAARPMWQELFPFRPHTSPDWRRNNAGCTSRISSASPKRSERSPAISFRMM